MSTERSLLDMNKLDNGSYYVVQLHDGSKQVWKRAACDWYRPGDEEKCPDSWVEKVIRKVKL